MDSPTVADSNSHIAAIFMTSRHLIVQTFFFSSRRTDESSEVKSESFSSVMEKRNTSAM